LRSWVAGVSALLTASAAQGEDAGKTYAKVGGWEISAESPNRCLMQKFYRSKNGKNVEGLTVLYAADKEGVLLFWSNDRMTYLPAKGDLELGLIFGKGDSVDQSWGSQTLHYDKLGMDYVFTRVFKSADEASRVLQALATNDHLGLLLGPALLTSIPLDASGAIEKLRECSRNGDQAR
jgi:hypothetical protein